MTSVPSWYGFNVLHLVFFHGQYVSDKNFCSDTTLRSVTLIIIFSFYSYCSVIILIIICRSPFYDTTNSYVKGFRPEN